MDDSNFAGMLEMLMDTDLDTTKQDCIRTSLYRFKDYLDQLIDQLKLKSGYFQLEMVPFDLRTVCDDILSIFCEKAQEKGLEVIKEYSHVIHCSFTAFYYKCTDFIFGHSLL